MDFYLPESDCIVMLRFITLLTVFLLPSGTALAETAVDSGKTDLTTHPLALVCLAVFILSYIVVLFEEKTHLRKSKPVMLGAGIIWILIGFMAKDSGIDHHTLRAAVFHDLEEYAAMMLFLLAAMTYISALQDRNIFGALRARLVRAGFNIRKLFWITGILAFFLSPIADNMTTALVMGAVVMAVGGNDPKFVLLACINIVNAANAGGAFSPFGDITTLMVWQAQKADFFEFFALFIPAVVNFLIPAIIMSFFVPDGMPWSLKQEEEIKPGGKTIVFLGICTIATAISFEQFLGIPPFLGMMTGLSFLMFCAYYIRHNKKNRDADFDVFKVIARSEWDTLLFFFGVIFSVGGLAFIGYLGMASHGLYNVLGHSAANISLGVISAIIDNIPVMFAVLSMDPEMPHFQWLLVTLTTGVGGSLLSIGSAAGVALMGISRGQYTFFGHLKWTPVLLLGYAAAITAHFLING